MASLESKPADAGIAAVGEASFPTLYLDGSQLAALGLSSEDMGKSMGFAANVKVVSFSTQGDGSATLEIKDAEVEKSTSDEDKATKIFDGGSVI